MLIKTTFIPTHKGVLYKSVTFTGSGEEIPADPVPMRYSIIRIRNQTRTTSVRTDQSGSQGRAMEDVFDGRILVHPEIEPEMNQVVFVNNRNYVVNEVQPKYDMAANLNHYQVDLVL